MTSNSCINPNVFVAKIEQPVLSRGALTPLNPLEYQNEIHIYLNQSVIFNSLGIREWILWLSPFAKNKDRKIVLHQCPVVMISQVNMLSDFLPANAIIESFYVPYINDETGESKLVLFRRGIEFDDTGVIDWPEISDSANKPMEMDVIPSSYFRFLSKS